MRHPQPQRGGVCHGLFRPGMIGAQQQIGTQQLIGLTRERLTDPVGKEADSRKRRHRQHQRRHQQTQLAGTRIAPKHAQGKAQHGSIGR